MHKSNGHRQNAPKKSSTFNGKMTVLSICGELPKAIIAWEKMHCATYVLFQYFCVARKPGMGKSIGINQKRYDVC